MAGDPGEEEQDEEGWLKGVLTLQDISDLDGRFRRLHAAAAVAGAVADAATPLLLHQELSVSGAAMLVDSRVASCLCLALGWHGIAFSLTLLLFVANIGGE